LSANTFGATSGTAASVTIVEIVFHTHDYSNDRSHWKSGDSQRHGGIGGCHLSILTSTNVTFPLVSVDARCHNHFSASGGFSYTNVIQPNLRAQFFRVILPDTGNLMERGRGMTMEPLMKKVLAQSLVRILGSCEMERGQ